jgi:hypothetical protein
MMREYHHGHVVFDIPAWLFAPRRSHTVGATTEVNN